MPLNFILLPLLFFLFTPLKVFANDHLEIKKILNSYSFDQKNYTLIIENLSNPKKLSFLHNQDKPFNAASLVKILTTFMALNELGPNFQWQSDLYTQGEINGETLNGDVVFKGRGDASFSLVDLEKMLRQLRSQGVKRIQGNLILDNSYFGKLPTEIVFDDNPMRAYNVLPNAISLQSNTINFKFVENNNDLLIEADPKLDALKVINKISLNEKNCHSWKSKIDYSRQDESNESTILFEGEFSKKCKNKEIDLSVMQNGQYFFEAFKKLWLQNGGYFDGSYMYANPDEQNLNLIAIHHSKVLSEMIRDVNKYSLNLMSRNLMLTMISENLFVAADEGMVNSFVNDWFENQGYEHKNLFIDNGAGLSRNINISGNQLKKILKEIYQHPLMPEMVASFPISAIDGTLEKRMLYSPIKAKGHLKTGSLRDVNAMAGFFHNEKKEMILFIFIMNDTKSDLSINLQEKLINEIFYLN